MTSFDRKHLWEIQAIRDVLLIAGGLSLLWLGYALSSITIPLLMALLLAYLVEPLVEGLGQRGVSRSRAAAWFVGSGEHNQEQKGWWAQEQAGESRAYIYLRSWGKCTHRKNFRVGGWTSRG